MRRLSILQPSLECGRVVRPEIRGAWRVEKKERHVVSQRAVKICELSAGHMFGYTGDTKSSVIAMKSASDVAERFRGCRARTIYQTGQVVGVIMQEFLLLIGLECQYMCLAFRSQLISMRNPPRKQLFRFDQRMVG